MTTSDLGHRIAAWADQRIEEMLSAPGMWGTSLEAVEMQILTLFEIRALALNFDREYAEPQRVIDEYVRLLGERFKGKPSQPAHQAVGNDPVQFAAVIREVSAALRERAPEPAVSTARPILARALHVPPHAHAPRTARLVPPAGRGA